MTWMERRTDLLDGRLPPSEAVFDANPIIRALAARMDLPARTINRLAHDPSPAVRAVIAARADLPAGVMEDLAWDACPRVRAVIAGRMDLPDRIRERLTDDRDPIVLDALGEHEAADVVRSMPAPLETGRKGFVW